MKGVHCTYSFLHAIRSIGMKGRENWMVPLCFYTPAGENRISWYFSFTSSPSTSKYWLVVATFLCPSAAWM